MASVPACMRPPRGVKLQKPRPLRTTSEMVKISEIVKDNLSKSFCQDIMEEEIQSKDILLYKSNVNKNDSNFMQSCDTDTDILKSVVDRVGIETKLTEDDNRSSDYGKKNEMSMKARRAPRSTKLDKPRPLKSSSLKTGNTSKPTNAIEREIESIMDTLKGDSLTIRDTQQLVLLFREHGSEMENTNKEFVNNAFTLIQDSLASKTLDKLSFICLVDLVALRNRNWETHNPIRETKRVSWKDIEDIANDDVDDEISSDHSDDVFGSKTPSYDTQQSLDSGFGEMEDEILWEDEESFLKDLKNEMSGSSLSEHQTISSPVRGSSNKPVTAVIEVNNSVCDTESNNRERIKICRQSSLTKAQCVPVIRDPLGSGSSSDLVSKVEKTMPGGRFTAKGRRLMFSKYAALMRDNDGHDLLNDSQTGRPYGIDELLHFSQSSLSKQQPEGWSYLVKIYPDICLVQANALFDKKEFVQKRMEQIAEGKLVRLVKTDKNENSNNSSGGILRSFSCGFEADSSSVTDFTEREHSKDMLKRRHSFGFGTPEKGGFNARERKSSGGFGTPYSASPRNSMERDNFSVSKNNGGFGTPVKSDNDQCEESVFSRNLGGFGTPDNNSARNSMECDIFSSARTRSGFGTPVKSDYDSDDHRSFRRNSGGFGSPFTKNLSQ